MTTTLKENVLDFSHASVGEAERGEGFMRQTWTGSGDGRSGTEPRREAVSPIPDLPFAAWSGWLARGIPELASPLAD
ncbi:MAG TPA: hypothetical protein PKI20_18555 [Verrucomicrobiota bacterium]|jgi:hypothetical protein|nr:hypothetical protein [Verrucomicrobiota bacterium]HQL79117.1 hypothetical protein [Verrucomicrobiota bacterium]